MNAITLPRETVQQALEALLYHVEQTRPIERTTAAITALRAALQQDEPLKRLTRLTKEMALYPWQEKAEPQGLCRDDGRCQYAIDHCAEGFGHCPAGKCVMPQTQAGEPEVVALRWPYKFRDIGETGAYEYHSSDFAELAHLPLGEELITLQSHREAMQNQTIGYEKTIDKLNDAITKKDAALKACVEALEKARSTVDPNLSPEHAAWANELDAAITQAQEAMK